jgi:hypothetical protein
LRTIITVSVLALFLAAAPELLVASRQILPPAPPATSPGLAPSTPRFSDDGRLEIGAVFVPASIEIDGVLDDALWRETQPVSGFVQAEPDEGNPATERTDVWVAFDEGYLYIAAYCHDQSPDGVVITDIRRDFQRENQDGFEVILDTFGDRRNGYLFATNAAGGRVDQQVANEGREVNTSWDAPWTARTQRVHDGWTLEMAIPFRSLRFKKGEEQVWGINFSRRIRRKNEVVFWAPIPRSYALTRLSLAGNLVGLGTASGGRDLRITPYAATRTARETGLSEFNEEADFGGDLKWGVTNGLTLDLTVNPDFAQAEADVQQVNLTQFPQFFPEKRDFFLENSGVFYVGDAARNTRISLAPRADTDLAMFFSRRMGLSDEGHPIPIDAGLRLTGREGGVMVGALALRTREREGVPASDYAVVRLRRNIFASSDVGGIFMMRRAVKVGDDYNRVYGGDANIRLPGTIDWSTFFVNTETPGLSGPRYAFQTSLNREANFVHVKLGLLSIGENFNDELGFYRRTGVRRWSADIGIRPRFASLRRLGIREMHPHILWNYYTDQSGEQIAKRFHNGHTLFFNNGGFAEFSVNTSFQLLTQPFTLHPSVDPIEPGSYGWSEYQLRFNTDPSQLVSFNFTGILGGLWSGTQRTVRAGVTVKPSYKFRTSINLSRTHGDLDGPGGTFVRELWVMRANYSFTTNMFIDALTQYDPDRDVFNANVRFNLIHHPLSDLYLVYNEQRFTADHTIPAGRSVILKLTHMLAF